MTEKQELSRESSSNDTKRGAEGHGSGRNELLMKLETSPIHSSSHEPMMTPLNGMGASSINSDKKEQKVSDLSSHEKQNQPRKLGPGMNGAATGDVPNESNGPNSNLPNPNKPPEEDPFTHLMNEFYAVDFHDVKTVKHFDFFFSEFAAIMGFGPKATKKNKPKDSQAGPEEKAGRSYNSTGIPPVESALGPRPVKPEFFWEAVHIVVFTVLTVFAAVYISKTDSLETPSGYNLVNADAELVEDSVPTDGSANADNLVDVSLPSFRFLGWIFSTAELLLQSSRFLIEKGAPPANAFFLVVANNVPRPYDRFVYQVARYGQMGMVVLQDFCLVVFVAGVCSCF